MKCIHCQNLNMQNRPEMTKLGFPKCSKLPTGCYVSISRNVPCKDFEMADQEIIDKREAWTRGRK